MSVSISVDCAFSYQAGATFRACCRDSSQPKLLYLMIIASILAIGMIAGITATAIVFIVRDRRKAQADARFEAAMQEGSGLGLDEVFEQVTVACKLPLACG